MKGLVVGCVVVVVRFRVVQRVLLRLVVNVVFLVVVAIFVAGVALHQGVVFGLTPVAVVVSVVVDHDVVVVENDVVVSSL